MHPLRVQSVSSSTLVFHEQISVQFIHCHVYRLKVLIFKSFFIYCPPIAESVWLCYAELFLALFFKDGEEGSVKPSEMMV